MQKSIPVSVVIGILGMFIGMVADRVYLGVQDAIAQTQLQVLQKTLDEVRQRQFKNEQHISEQDERLDMLEMKTGLK